MKRCLLFAALLVHLLAAGAQGGPRYGLEVVPLRNRSAEQVIPVLRPLLDPGAAMTGQGYQLFVRTSPRNLEDLKRALAAIDTAQRRLLISVRFDANADASRNSLGARVISSRSAADERVDQRVQVLEGNRAHISTGQSRPLQQQQVFVGQGAAPGQPLTNGVSGLGVVAAQNTTVIQNLDTGFDVTPRVSGNTVFLDINPQRETPGTLGEGSVQSQRVSSSISVPLGEWVELGGAVESGSGADSGVLSTRDARSGEARRVWVRVEELRP